MPNKIELDEKKVIREYKKGKSSLKLAKEFNVSKPKILKILNAAGVVRKRGERCEKLDIKFDGKVYYIYWECPICKKMIKKTAKNKWVLCRNYYRDVGNVNCKRCSLDLQVGKGNPFYGKKHTEETKKKVSESRKGKATGSDNAMANKEYREKAIDNSIKSSTLYPLKSKIENEILKKLKKKYNKVKGSYRVNYYVYDFYLPDYNLIIEFNGDYWHCNPEKYDSTYYNQRSRKTANEIWGKDKRKIDFILNKGYNCEVIWENDYNKNPEIIDEIIEKYVKN